MLKPTDSADLTAGWAMTQDQPPVIEDDAEAWGHVWDTLEPERGMEVASLGGPLGRMIGRSVAKSVKQAPITRSDEAALAMERILMRVPPAPEAETLLPPTLHSTRPQQVRKAEVIEGKAVIEEPEFAPVVPEDRAFNVGRAHPGASQQDLEVLANLAANKPEEIVRMVNSAEQLAVVLDTMGRYMQERPRTHRQIANEATLQNLWVGVQRGGLLSDTQLYALRSLTATMWDQYVSMSNAIDTGNHTPQLLGEFLTMNQSLTALFRYMKGQTRETARALAQQRMIATTLQYQDIAGLETAMSVAGSGQDAIINNAKALAEKIRKGQDPAEALIGSIENATTFGALIDFWKSNNLSSFATQSSNAISSIAVSAFELGQKGLAAGIGAARRAAGAERTYEAAEFGETMIGAMSGLRHAHAVFWNTLTTGNVELGARPGKEAGPSQVHAIFGQRMGLTENQSELLMTPAYRVMQAMDESLMYPTYMAELSSLAARDGINRGLKGEALRQHIDGMIIDKEPPYEWREQALAVARKVIMQSPEAPEWTFAALGEHAYRLVQAYPVLNFIAPWVRTPARILDYAIESTVLNAVNPKLYKQLALGGAEADIAAAKIVSGVALTAMMYPLAASMRVTGAGPADPDQRKKWEAAGWQAYSISVNGKYISYKNWADPIMGLFGAVATAVERAQASRDEAQAAKMFVNAAFAVAEYMLDSSYLEGFKRLVTALEDPAGRGVAELAGSIATGFVPLSGMMAQAARTMDDTERAKTRTRTPGHGGTGYVEDLFKSVEQDFKLRMPGWRDTARPRRYWDGEVMIPEEGRAVRMLTSIKERAIKNDAATAELVEYGVSPSEPRSRLEFPMPIGPIDLLDLDDGLGKVYDNYILAVGKARRTVVEKLINSSAYPQLTAEQKGLELERAMSAGLEIGQATFKADVYRRYQEGTLPRQRQRVPNDVMDKLLKLRGEGQEPAPIGFQP